MNIEDKTSFVFGQTFKEYDDNEFNIFLSYLKKRLVVNNIDLNIFKDKVCLDAGCGGGRGSVLMCELGAEEVFSYDLSKENCNTVERISVERDLPIAVRQGNLLDIPYLDNTFDIVWCNGVLHHTINPTRGLKEIIRVLKEDGYMWLYLYGAGGIYWYIIDFIREKLKNVDSKIVLQELKKLGCSTNKIAEFMDDWKVPILEKYTVENLEEVLSGLGMDFIRLIDGVDYDTCKRVDKFNEKELMGDGDLRYWCKKKKLKLENNTDYSDLIKRTMINDDSIEFFVKLQTKLREEMNKNESFNLDKFLEEVK